MKQPFDPIDPEWLKAYVDQLIELAGKLSPGPLQDATMLRVEHAFDLIEAWKGRKKT